MFLAREKTRRSVILSIQGGLGNQLFQWALGESLRGAGVDVIIDTSRCRGDRPFAIGELVAEWPRLRKLQGLRLIAAQRLGMLGRMGSPQLIREIKFGFDDGLKERVLRGGASYLLGYFQSPQYFSSVTEQIRERAHRFLESSLTSDGVDLATELKQDHRSFALHVRRGDYVSNPVAAAHHGALGVDYYHRAVEVGRGAGYTRRVWFSDDPAWVEEHLASAGDLVCDDSLSTSPGGEIALMARCRARAIANSSFSWWAGWLGPVADGGGMVMAPERWFANRDDDASDLVPRDWLRL